MAQYTARELRNITKSELIDILEKEGIEYDKTMPYFALRAKLLNKDENKNDDSMARKNNKTEEPAVKNSSVEKVEEVIKETEETVETQAPAVESPAEEVIEVKEEEKPQVKSEPVKQEKKVPAKSSKTISSTFSVLKRELAKRKGIFGTGNTAFASELAKRRGERVSGTTFAQELKNRQLKYGR